MAGSASKRRLVVLGVVAAVVAGLIAVVRPAASGASVFDVTSVSVPANGTYKAGASLGFIVNFNGAVDVDTTGGTPTLALTIGSTAVAASYVSGSGTSTLTFAYTVQSGQSDADGITIGSLSANGATIRDHGGSTDADLTLNSVGSTAGVLVDGVAPTASVAASDPGTYHTGIAIDFSVETSENVIVSTGGGTPYLPITVGSTARTAAYVGGSGTSELTFRYTVQSGDVDTDGVAVGSAIVPNGGTLRDSAGNDLVTTLTSIGDQSAVLVDGAAPAVTSIALVGASPTNATSLGFTVTFSRAVTGVDASDFSLATTRTAAGTIGSVTGSGATYTVTVGSVSGDGSLRLDLKGGGTGITDTAFGDAISGGFASGESYAVDHTAPTVESVTVPAAGVHPVGQSLDFTVATSEPVVVTGSPTLELQFLVAPYVTPDVNAEYVSGSGTSSLLFRYTIHPGDTDPAGLNVLGIDPSGGTLRDAAGNDLALALHGVGDTSGVLIGVQSTTDQSSAAASSSSSVSSSSPVSTTPVASPPPPSEPQPHRILFQQQTLQGSVHVQHNGLVSFDLPADSFPPVSGFLVTATTLGASITEPSVTGAGLPAFPFLPPSYLPNLATNPVASITIAGLTSNGAENWVMSFVLSAAPKPDSTPSQIPGWAFALDRWRTAPTADRGARPAAAPTTVPSWYWQWAAWHRKPFTISAQQ